MKVKLRLIAEMETDEANNHLEALAGAPMTTGAYVNASHDQIFATLATLRHFKAFLASSDCNLMHDPYSGWMKTELTKQQATAKLHWLVEVAINRKAGIPDAKPDSALWRFSRLVNTPRLIVRERDCPKRYRARLAHRLTTAEDERGW